MADTPLSKLDPDGQPAVINYNVPEPTSYAGENIIELEIADDAFMPAAFLVPDSNFDNLAPTAPAMGAVARPRKPKLTIEEVRERG